MKLKIDPEFEEKIPPLTEEEFRQLENNILSDGVVINPIIIWNGVIVDGHNRFHIVEQHPEIKYTTHEKYFDDRYAVIAWICKNQLGRRNLTPEQKKYLIGKQYEAEKAAQGGNHGNQYTSLAKCQLGTLPKADTADRIAKENGIGRRSVFRAETFAKAVDIADVVEPGIRSNLLAGEIRAKENDIRDLILAEPENRPAILERIKKPPPKNQVRHRKKNTANPVPNLAHQIGDEMLEARSNGNPETMLYEMNDALGSLTFRWNFCYENYRSFFEDDNYRERINQIIQKGLKYMKDCEGGKFANETDRNHLQNDGA